MDGQVKDMRKTTRTPEWFRNFLRDNGVVIIFIVIFLIATIFIPYFFEADNFLNIVKQASVPIIVCIGMTMVLMTGGIDLSAGYIIGFISVFVGILTKIIGMPAWLGIILSLFMGIGIGIVNGIIVEKIKVPAFIGTLGTGYVLLGIGQLISEGTAISKLPEDLLAFGRTPIGESGLNMMVIISLIVIVIFYFVLHHTTYGRMLTAFGYNHNASYVSGLKTPMIHISAYALSGVLSALAGILLTIRVNNAQPTMGGGTYTFEVVTAAIVGGASLFGGKGTVIGSVLGVFIIKIIENCINLAGVNYYMYQAVMGLVILAALIFESVKNKVLQAST